MEYSRPGSTIAKAVCFMALSAPCFAAEVSLGVDNIVVHDMGYRMVYQSPVLTGVSVRGGYPLMKELSVIGVLGYALSQEDLGPISADLNMLGLGAGIRYTPIDFILRPYVTAKVGALLGWTDFSDGYNRYREVSFVFAGDVLAGVEVSIVRRTWGRIALFYEFGWEEAFPLNFGGLGRVDISGLLSRFGGAIEF